jgi:hypothetical protein
MSFGFPPEVASYKVLAASGIVGDSGLPIDVVGYTINSKSTAGAITLKNGTAASNTAAWADTATAVSQENVKALAYPVRLNAGCYVSFDSNVNQATIFYRQMYT